MIIGSVGTLNDKAVYPDIEEGKIVVKHLPIGFSKNGQWQFIYDNFYDKDLECDNTVIDGDTQKVPSGIISIEGVEIIPSNSLNSNNRILKQELEEGGLIKQYKTKTGRADFIYFSLSGKLNIRCSSTLQSFLIIEAIVDYFYKIQKFNFSWSNYDKIGCALEIGDSVSRKQKFNYTPNDVNKVIEFEFPIKIESYKPRENRVNNYPETVKEFIENTTIKE